MASLQKVANTGLYCCKQKCAVLSTFRHSWHYFAYEAERLGYNLGTDTSRDSSLDDLLDALQNFSEASNPESLASEQEPKPYLFGQNVIL